MDTICRQDAEGLAIVEVRGDVDIFAASAFKEALFQCLDLAPRQLVVDLSGCGFIDSTGLGVLVAALKRARGCRLSLVCGDDLGRILAILGLDRVMELRATRSEAVRASAAPPSDV